jgi:hypothetical protein
LELEIRNNSIILNLSPRVFFGPFFFKRRVDEASNIPTEQRCTSCVNFKKSAVYPCQIDPYNLVMYKKFLPGKCFYFCKNDYQTFFYLLNKVQHFESQISDNLSFSEIWRISGSNISKIIYNFCKRDLQISLRIYELDFKINDYLDNQVTTEDNNSMIKEIEFSRSIITEVLSDKKYQKNNVAITEREIILSYIHIIDKMLPLLLF